MKKAYEKPELLRLGCVPNVLTESDPHVDESEKPDSWEEWEG